MTVRTILMAALVAGATSACGGSGGGYSTGSNMNAGGGAANGVAIQDFYFSPTALSVKVGTTVTWSNMGAAAHHPVADSGAFDVGQLAAAQSGPYGGGNGVGGTGSFTFGTQGTFTYHCSIHPQMTGTITVTP
jgi:plastocyanin